MKYDLRSPCPECPFRKEGTRPVRLMEARVVEIHNAVTQWYGGDFPCHKTTESGGAPSGKSQQCPGAVAYALKVGEVPQVVTFGLVKLGGAKREDYASDEVFESLDDFKASAFDYEGGEFCSVANIGCEAPAGYSTGNGGVTHGDTYAECECVECGQPVCSACLSECGRCEYCAEWGQEAEE